MGVGRQGQCGGKSPQNDLTSPRKSPIIITYSDHAEETCRIRRFFRERAPQAESPSSRRARYSPASRTAEQNFKRSRIPALRGNEARYLQPFRKAFAFCISAVRGGGLRQGKWLPPACYGGLPCYGGQKAREYRWYRGFSRPVRSSDRTGHFSSYCSLRRRQGLRRALHTTPLPPSMREVPRRGGGSNSLSRSSLCSSRQLPPRRAPRSMAEFLPPSLREVPRKGRWE